MKSKSSNIQKGDKVMIVEGPIDKVGKIGIVTTLAGNGAIIRFPDGNGTAVKFEHLKKLKGGTYAN